MRRLYRTVHGEAELSCNLQEWILRVWQAELMTKQRGFGRPTTGFSTRSKSFWIDQLLSLLHEAAEVAEHGGPGLKDSWAESARLRERSMRLWISLAAPQDLGHIEGEEEQGELQSSRVGRWENPHGRLNRPHFCLGA